MRKGHGYRKSATSGSHAHHGERTGAGPAAGAGMVLAGGPGAGRTGSKVRPNMAGAKFQGGAGGSMPKGISVYKEGS